MLFNVGYFLKKVKERANSKKNGSSLKTCWKCDKILKRAKDNMYSAPGEFKLYCKNCWNLRNSENEEQNDKQVQKVLSGKKIQKEV